MPPPSTAPSPQTSPKLAFHLPDNLKGSLSSSNWGNALVPVQSAMLLVFVLTVAHNSRNTASHHLADMKTYLERDKRRYSIALRAPSPRARRAGLKTFDCVYIQQSLKDVKVEHAARGSHPTADLKRNADLKRDTSIQAQKRALHMTTGSSHFRGGLGQGLSHTRAVTTPMLMPHMATMADDDKSGAESDVTLSTNCGLSLDPTLHASAAPSPVATEHPNDNSDMVELYDALPTHELERIVVEARKTCDRLENIFAIAQAMLAR
ncbi:hypothetical protein FISHEDRAFT_54930 [Fistulina hepatica ATCC 64428]|uniref:Uncharacterized protein n=1 Tax=Fistulina hepatica ATCC 64428 TaxID=1128425 RepID=A0A0D7APZ6_9AGAR|nr:hypothetical protein FISHEDRAFT_54930 [Fistulina hepatica ATCC 64428]